MINTTINYFIKNAVIFEKQPFHIVEPSPWPIVVSGTLLANVILFVMYMHRLRFQLFDIFLPVAFYTAISLWLLDIIYESYSHHNSHVLKCLKLGFQLFILSEIMFFFAFFSSFFYLAVYPSIWIGSIWPPFGIIPISYSGLPLLNTLILLSSGVCLTWAHRSIFIKENLDVKKALSLTLLLAVIFLSCQLFEYKNAQFSINSGVFGSIFYLMTGFHGFHVFIGFIFLGVCLYRTYINEFSEVRHFGLEAAIWYWHFVDVVWIWLWLFVYVWAS